MGMPNESSPLSGWRTEFERIHRLTARSAQTMSPGKPARDGDETVSRSAAASHANLAAAFDPEGRHAA